MKHLMRNLALISAIVLLPNCVYSWETPKIPIEDVPVGQVLLTDKNVFCAGMGLFVFERETETWRNYSVGNGFPSNTVTKIEKGSAFADVWLRAKKSARFNLNTETYELIRTTYNEHSLPSYTLEADGKTYEIVSNTVTVRYNEEEKVFSPSNEPPGYSEKQPEYSKGYDFTFPAIHEDKIYFVYDFRGRYSHSSMGMASFDLHDNTFQYYPTDIFNYGTVTGCVKENSCLILSTARFRYEYNAEPSVGLVKFCPADSSFQVWDKLPLPNYPLAIFCIAKDNIEFWLGTNKGIFRIKEETNECIHYNITKGIMPRDGVNIYGYYDKGYPVVAELNKGAIVKLLAVYGAWCEIQAPTKIEGHVSSTYFEEVPDQKRPKKVRIKPIYNSDRIKVKVGSSQYDNNLLLIHSHNPPEDEYITTGGGGKGGERRWYKIIIPTAWIPVDSIYYKMERVLN